MSKKHKVVVMALNCVEHLLILASAISRCVSISTFASLVWISIGTASCTEGIKFFAITAGNKEYKSVIKRKKKKHNKIGLLAKTKLKSIDVLISTALIDSYISHNDFVSVKNVLNESNDMKEAIKNQKSSTIYKYFYLFLK